MLPNQKTKPLDIYKSVEVNEQDIENNENNENMCLRIYKRAKTDYLYNILLVFIAFCIMFFFYLLCFLIYWLVSYLH